MKRRTALEELREVIQTLDAQLARHRRRIEATEKYLEEQIDGDSRFDSTITRALSILRGEYL